MSSSTMILYPRCTDCGARDTRRYVWAGRRVTMHLTSWVVYYFELHIHPWWWRQWQTLKRHTLTLRNNDTFADILHAGEYVVPSQRYGDSAESVPTRRGTPLCCVLLRTWSQRAADPGTREATLLGNWSSDVRACRCKKNGHRQWGTNCEWWNRSCRHCASATALTGLRRLRSHVFTLVPLDSYTAIR
jgi:hypothetical protein